MATVACTNTYYMKQLMMSQQVLVTGGYTVDGGYATNGFLYDLERKAWEVKPYLTPSGGKRIDHVCGTVTDDICSTVICAFHSTTLNKWIFAVRT